MTANSAGRGFGTTIGIASAAALILGISPLAAHGAASLYAWMSGMVEAGVAAPGQLEARQTLHTAVYFAALHGAVAVLTLAAALALFGQDWARLGLAPASGRGPGYVSSAVCLLAGIAVWLFVLTTGWPEAMRAEIGDYPRLVRTGWGILMVPVLCLLAPIAEELLFRGLLFKAMSATPAGPWASALVSSALWAGLHVDHSLLSQMHLFAAGLALSWLVERTGSLHLATWCHVIFNLALTGILLAVTSA